MSDWNIKSENYDLKFCGVAPVVARGTFVGFPAFFHQRWEIWELSLYTKETNLDKPVLHKSFWSCKGYTKNGIVIETENEAKSYLDFALEQWQQTNKA